MPSEIISVTSQIVTNAARDYYIASDYYTDDQTPDASLTTDFWDNATITLSQPVVGQLRIYTYNNVGGQDLNGLTDTTATEYPFSTIVGYSSDRDVIMDRFGTRAEYDNHALSGKGVFFDVLHDGTAELPDTITITSTWEYEHFFGQDPDEAQHFPYTMNLPGGVVDVSTWTANPNVESWADNEGFIAATAYAGHDLDVASDYFSIAVYGRDIAPPGDITGVYLGADRRFMGF